MKTPSYKDIHKQFRLNGNSYEKEELKEVAYSLVKEGDDYEISIGDFLLDWLDNKPTLTALTSGSTGKPKLIVLKKQHMVNSACATGDFFKLQEKNKALLCLPASFIAGKMMLVRAMVIGLSIDCVNPSARPMEETNKSYDFVAMVPLQFENSLENLNDIDTLIVGGAPISYKLRSKFLNATHATKVFETYGMTETITHIAVKPLTDQEFGSDSFNALSSVKIAIDARGCLTINAPLVSDIEIQTNDIVELVDETKFKWLGRFDNIINSGGVKLFPEEIEAKLASAVDSRFFVTSIPDEKLGQKLVLVVEGSQDRQVLQNKLLKLSTFKKYEIPKAILLVNSFEETTSGKVKRKATLDKIAF